MKYTNAIVMMFIVVVTPTFFGMIGNVTFNSVFPAGGLMMLLFMLNIAAMFSIRFTKLQMYLLMYVLLNVLAYLLMLMNFRDYIEERYTYDVTLSFITSTAILASSVIYHTIIIRKKISISNIHNYFFIGVVSNAGILFGVVMIIGIQSYLIDPYIIRDTFHIYSMKQLTDSQYHGGGDLPEWFGVYYQMMGGTAAIGPFFSMCGVFFVMYYNSVRKKLKSLHLIIAGFSCLILAILMGSRSAIVSMIGAILITLIVVSSNNDKKKIYANVLLGVIFAISIILMLLILSDSVAALKMFQLEILLEQPRLSLWSKAILLSLINPIGYGYDYIYMVKQTGGAFPLGIEFDFNHVHNIYIGTLLELGCMGFIILILLIKNILRECYKNIMFFKGSRYYPLSVAVFAALVASFIQFNFAGLFLKTIGIYSSVFWFFVSIVFILSHYRRNSIT
jgi:hypothetical protein